MGAHNIVEYPKTTNKFVNCANQKFKTTHEINHTTNDSECPSYKYQIKVMRSKTDCRQ